MFAPPVRNGAPDDNIQDLSNEQVEIAVYRVNDTMETIVKIHISANISSSSSELEMNGGGIMQFTGKTAY